MEDVTTIYESVVNESLLNSIAGLLPKQHSPLVITIPATIVRLNGDTLEVTVIITFSTKNEPLNIKNSILEGIKKSILEGITKKEPKDTFFKDVNEDQLGLYDTNGDTLTEITFANLHRLNFKRITLVKTV